MSTPLAREYRDDLPIGLIDPPMLDARIDRDPEKLEELAADIKKRGLIFPLAVVRVESRFEVVDGYRRYLASKRAGLGGVPVFIYPTKEIALEGVKYAANAFREDMSPAEEAIFFNELMLHECEQDIERVCALVGKSFSYVSSRLELIQGFEQVFEAVRARKISLGVAALLNKSFPAEWIDMYLLNAIRSGATITEVTAWVQDWKRSIGDVPQRAALPSDGSISAPGSAHDPNTCLLCGRADHTHAIRWRPMHTHCELAILEPLLKGAAGSSD